MEVTAYGRIREELSLLGTKKVQLYLFDQAEVARLQRVFLHYANGRTDWISPLRRSGSDWYITMTCKNFISVLDPKASGMELSEWVGRVCRARFTLRAYNFPDSSGRILHGVRCILQNFEVDLVSA
jgi:hypothetical protein